MTKRGSAKPFAPECRGVRPADARKARLSCVECHADFPAADLVHGQLCRDCNEELFERTLGHRSPNRRMHAMYRTPRQH